MFPPPLDAVCGHNPAVYLFGVVAVVAQGLKSTRKPLLDKPPIHIAALALLAYLSTVIGSVIVDVVYAQHSQIIFATRGASESIVTEN